MQIVKSTARLRFLTAVAVFLTLLTMASCAPKVNYSYDLGMNFAGLKSYKWDCSIECPTNSKAACTPALARKDTIVESNVRFFADQVLKEKGFHKSCEKPDFVISINYDCETASPQDIRRLRMLVLNISRGENETATVWRGIASGAIATTGDSHDLNMAVRDILSKFPPK